MKTHKVMAVRVRKRRKSKNPLRNVRLERGYTLDELSALTGLSPSYLSRLEGGSRRLNTDIIDLLVKALQCRPSDLVDPQGQSAFENTEKLESEEASTYMLHQGGGASYNPSGALDLPLYHACASGEGKKIQFDFSKPKGWIQRLPELRSVSQAFAIEVSDQACSPKFEQGDRLYVHPTKPLTEGCTALVITLQGESVVGRFNGWKTESLSKTNGNQPLSPSNDDKLLFEFFGDKGIQSISRADVQGLFRVVGMVENA